METVFIPPLFIQWPIADHKLLRPGSKPGGTKNQKIVSTPCQSTRLAHAHSMAHHGKKMLTATCGERPQDFGCLTLELEDEWAKWKQNHGWPISLTIQPQPPFISKDWSFVVLFFFFSSKSTVTEMKHSKAFYTPTAFFLLFTVLGGKVSRCPFARKAKQVWPAENLIVFIPPYQEMKDKATAAALCG